MEWTLPLRTRRATQRLGAALARELEVGDVVVLEGPLGAGKTFLARAIARGLGVPSRLPVASPTFALVHELPARVPVVHADLYRLAAVSDVESLGLDEVRATAITIVEWGARFAGALGRDRLVITLSRASDDRREAKLHTTGPRSDRIGTNVAAALAAPVMP